MWGGLSFLDKGGYFSTLGIFLLRGVFSPLQYPRIFNISYILLNKNKLLLNQF
nr:MAG TPA: hypothetical protein [Caudoviricetes sp.]